MTSPPTWPIATTILAPVAAGTVVWRSNGQLRASVIVKATFSLSHGGDMILVEPEDLSRAEKLQRNSVQRGIDLAPWLARADVVFTGHAHIPSGPAPVHSVRIAVYRGPALLEKTLHVYGDRRKGAPEPFQKMHLLWDRAFGGAGWDANPIGVGFDQGREPDRTAANIVNPVDPTRSDGFGPISRFWPIRRRLLGKTNRKQLEGAIAEVPPNFDWAYYQSAPADQRCDYLQGDEWVVLDGLHPELPRVQSRLPSVRAAGRLYGLEAEPQPVTLVADTLHIDGDEEICSLIWRGNIPLPDESVIPALQFVVGLEQPGRLVQWPETVAPPARTSGPELVPQQTKAPVDMTVAADPGAIKQPAVPFQPGSPWAVAAVAAVAPNIAPPPAPPSSSGEPRKPGFDETRVADEAVLAAARKRPAVPFQSSEPTAPPAARFDETRVADEREAEIARKRPAVPFQPGSPWAAALPPPRMGPPPPPPSPSSGEERFSGTVVPTDDEIVNATRRAPVPFAGQQPPAPRPQPQNFQPVARILTEPLPPLPAISPRQPPARPEPPARKPASPAGPEIKPRATGHDGGRPPMPPGPAGAVRFVNETTLVAFTLPWHPKPSQSALAVIVKGTFDIVPDGPAKLREETEMPNGDLHAGDEMLRSLLYPTDFVPFKPKADITLKGHAYAPGGSSPASLARFRFGRGGKGFDRQIAVFGERRWQQVLAPTEPRRFDKVPLVYELSFGGPGFDQNPIGRGYGAATLLPMLEDPGHLIKGPSDTPAPAGFGPIPMLWAARWSKLGTYDAKWHEERWPHFPEDFDWTFFQAAPPAQQVEKVEGDEPFEIIGMHPQHPKLDGKLPGVTPRCFVQRTTEGKGAFSEIVMRLDTVSFDVDEMKINLVWRGLVEVKDDDASEVAELFVMLDPQASHDGGRPPIPPGPAGLVAARDRYTAMKAPKAPPAASPDADRLIVGPSGAPIADAAAVLPMAANDAAPARERPPPHLDPKRREASAMLARGEPLDGWDAEGADLSDLDFSGRSLSGANLQDTLLRRALFTGADLTGAQLANADLTDAVLERANLTQADLTGANVEGARFDGADLTSADLGGARGERASFREARGARTRFGEGTWTRARFEKAELGGADFTAASIDEAVFDGAVMPEIRLYDARGAKVSFDGATLTGARADGVMLIKSSLKGVSAASSVWDLAVLDETTFRGAILTGAGFAKVSGPRAVFAGADLANGRLGRARLAGASFLKANLMEASLEAADLTRADLRAANLHGAETWKAKLEGAQLELALVTQTKLAGRT